MQDNQKDVSSGSAPEIRIERMNTEKTRRDAGSETVYHVYFELSGYPPPEWRDIFAREWKGLNLNHEATLDGMFLVLHCPLLEVAGTQLPSLKKTVSATNAAYREFAEKEAVALEHREDAWKEERKEVESMAASLRFD
jgi:hypothetical protein